MTKPSVVPPSRVRYFGSGEHCADPQLGALVLVRHNSLAAKIIRFGEWLHLWLAHLILGAPKPEQWWRVNHAMTVVETGAAVKVSEQASRGGQIVDLIQYAHLAYAVVEVIGATPEQQRLAAAVGNYYAGIDYGWPSIISDSIYILTGAPVALTIGQSAVCSTSGSEAQRCFGFIPSKADIAELPSDLAQANGVVIPTSMIR